MIHNRMKSQRDYLTDDGVERIEHTLSIEQWKISQKIPNDYRHKILYIKLLSSFKFAKDDVECFIKGTVIEHNFYRA